MQAAESMKSCYLIDQYYLAAFMGRCENMNNPYTRYRSIPYKDVWHRSVRYISQNGLDGFNIVSSNKTSPIIGVVLKN